MNVRLSGWFQEINELKGAAEARKNFIGSSPFKILSWNVECACAPIEFISSVSEPPVLARIRTLRFFLNAFWTKNSRKEGGRVIPMVMTHGNFKLVTLLCMRVKISNVVHESCHTMNALYYKCPSSLTLSKRSTSRKECNCLRWKVMYAQSLKKWNIRCRDSNCPQCVKHVLLHELPVNGHFGLRQSNVLTTPPGYNGG